LKLQGYDLETSGIFDENTKKCVIDFQKKVKIPADGVVGAQTMEKILTA
jgi:peptidoglycan hydrolase-like protein with peptidoglycan-binding domain